MENTTIKGYKVVCLKPSSKSKTHHYIYIKEHTVREKCKEKPAERTLFLLGLPPYCTEESLKTAFCCCGTITSVFLQSKPTATAPVRDESVFFPTHSVIKGFKVGYIVFDTPLGVESAVNLDSTIPLLLSTDEKPLITGVRKWCQEYNNSIIDAAELQADIDKFMAKFDKKEEEELEKIKNAGEPDSEGWVTVTKKGRNPGFARKESIEKEFWAKRGSVLLRNNYSISIGSKSRSQK